MSTPSEDLLFRATTYATARGCVLKHSLGFGKDGAVYSSTTGTAIKVFHSSAPNDAEKACYLRLAEWQVLDVLGHRVPQLISWDDALQVIELTIVFPPYLLEFASVRLDWPPDFPAEVLEQWEYDRAEEFGPRWPHIKLLMEWMADRYGIYLFDVYPRNITFADDSSP